MAYVKHKVARAVVGAFQSKEDKTKLRKLRASAKYEGRYLMLTVTEQGQLRIKISKEGKEYLREMVADEDGPDYVGMWLNLLEDIRCNSSWDYILPEKLGALTEAPIIGFEVGWDDDGELEENEDTTYWWFSNYQIENEWDTLLSKGQILFDKA